MARPPLLCTDFSLIQRREQAAGIQHTELMQMIIQLETESDAALRAEIKSNAAH